MGAVGARGADAADQGDRDSIRHAALPDRPVRAQARRVAVHGTVELTDLRSVPDRVRVFGDPPRDNSGRAARRSGGAAIDFGDPAWSAVHGGPAAHDRAADRLADHRERGVPGSDRDRRHLPVHRRGRGVPRSRRCRADHDRVRLGPGAAARRGGGPGAATAERPMIALALLVVVLPLVPTFATLVSRRARTLGAICAVCGAGTCGVAVALAIELSPGARVHALSGFLSLDPLSGFFVATIALVVALSSWGSAAYLRAEEDRGELSALQVRLYFAAFGVFASMMLAAFETSNLGLLWVLIEASTLASCVLVGLEAKAVSLEAAWKYIIISSFGVTMALVGTLFVYYAAGSLPGSPTEHLTWSYLFAHADSLGRDSLRLGFLLVLIGYGTKVGLAPMHTWLPDAHSEAPSPASAMLSAALLNTGMYAIIRFQALTGPALGTRFAGHALLIFGFASVLVGALFIVLRGNFKRMYAYSSIEQMGIIAIALGFGGVLGFYGALLQILTHAVAKAVLFLTSGDIVLRYRTRLAGDVRGVLSVAPLTGAVLLLT